MNKAKFYKIVCVILILINLGTVALFWFNRPPQGPPQPGDLADRLGITTKLDELTALEAEHHKKKKKLMSLDHSLHEKLFEKIGSGEDVTQIQDQINTNYMEISSMTYDFFDNVANYCTPEQLKELKSTVDRAFGQLRGPGHKRP
ncbi:MAG: C-terminal processing protease CtpA/Prc [Crocinitomicaceae bacterium]|jgi:C-terminal processing protease CtpA/Prc